jgi:hypothetical protein
MASMDKAFALGFGFTRQQSLDGDKTIKDDNQLYPNYVVSTGSVLNEADSQHFTEVFWRDVYNKYANEIGILNQLDRHTTYGTKLQRTAIGGGYHVWHCEHSSGDNANRLMAYILYLNDVDEGGETEFLYQHCRVKAKQGSVVLFPAGFTHTHRGNPPLSNEKYILTGWIEF